MNPLVKVSILALTLVTLVNSSLLWLTYNELSKEGHGRADIGQLQHLARDSGFIEGIITGNKKATSIRIDGLIGTHVGLTTIPLCIQLKNLLSENKSISEHCSPDMTLHLLMASKKELLSGTIPVMNKQIRIGEIGWVYLCPEPTPFLTYIGVIWIFELLTMVYIFFNCQRKIAKSVMKSTIGANKYLALSAQANHMATLVSDNMKKFPVTNECLIMWYKHPYTHVMDIHQKTIQLRGSISTVASATQLLCPMVQISRSTYVNKRLLSAHGKLVERPSSMEIKFNSGAIEPLEITKAYRNAAREVFEDIEDEKN